MKNFKADLLVNKEIHSFYYSLLKGLMNNSFYQVIPYDKHYFKKLKKKASHKCGRVMGNLIFKPNS